MGAALDEVGEVDAARDAACGRFAINLPRDLLRQASACDFRPHDRSARNTRRNPAGGARCIHAERCVNRCLSVRRVRFVYRARILVDAAVYGLEFRGFAAPHPLAGRAG